MIKPRPPSLPPPPPPLTPADKDVRSRRTHSFVRQTSDEEERDDDYRRGDLGGPCEGKRPPKRKCRGER